MKPQKPSIQGLGAVQKGSKSKPILPQQKPKKQVPTSIPPHHAVATRLLPLVKGWEAIFIRQLLSQKYLLLNQEPRFLAILERHAEVLQESQGERICRHCGAAAVAIDRFTYECDRACGVIMNLDFFGGEV